MPTNLPTYTWAKVYFEILDEPKLEGKPPSWKWLWVGLILLAKQSEDGILPKYQSNAKWLSCKLELKTQDVSAALVYFSDPEIRMIWTPEDGDNAGRIILPNLGKRQDRKPSNAPEQVKRRVERWREAHAAIIPDDDVTPLRVTNALHSPSEGVSNLVTNALQSDDVTPLKRAGNAPVTPSRVRALALEGRGERGELEDLSDLPPVVPKGTSVTKDPKWVLFKAGYPKNGGSWKLAEACWKNLSEADKDAALAALPNYAASKRVTEGYAKNVEAWLRGRFWENWPEPERTAAKQDEKGYELSARDEADLEEMWAQRVRG